MLLNVCRDAGGRKARESDWRWELSAMRDEIAGPMVRDNGIQALDSTDHMVC